MGRPAGQTGSLAYQWLCELPTHQPYRGCKILFPLAAATERRASLLDWKKERGMEAFKEQITVTITYAETHQRRITLRYVYLHQPRVLITAGWRRLRRLCRSYMP